VKCSLRLHMININLLTRKQEHLNLMEHSLLNYFFCATYKLYDKGHSCYKWKITKLECWHSMCRTVNYVLSGNGEHKKLR
jgi:hypothetical protein